MTQPPKSAPPQIKQPPTNPKKPTIRVNKPTKDNTRLWGSNYELGWKVGTDKAAISHTTTGLSQMQKYFNELVKKEYKFLEA